MSSADRRPISGPVVKVSKLDAARRQLDLAVRLFFLRGDPVAMHSLAAAARDLLTDLAASQGKSGLLDSIVKNSVRPDRLKEVQQMLREAQSFFKHADRDPGELLDFRPETTEFILWDACLTYQTLTTELPSLFLLFEGWFAIKRPHVIMPEEVRQRIRQGQHGLHPDDREGFFRLLPDLEAARLSG